MGDKMYDNWGYYDENFSMCGCSQRNRLTGKELEERHKNLSRNYYKLHKITKKEYFNKLNINI